MITVELSGVEIFGRHGVLDEERRDGQTYLYDVRLECSDSALSDRIEDAVDYRAVVARIQEVSDSRSFQLIEALAAAVADALIAGFPVAHVSVRVRKRRPGGLPMEWAAARVARGSASQA